MYMYIKMYPGIDFISIISQIDLSLLQLILIILLIELA